MGLENKPDKNWTRREARVSPEEKASRNEEGRMMGWEDSADMINEEYVQELARHSDLVLEIRRRGYPNDEKTCEEIGQKIGYGGQEVLRVAELLKERDQEKEGVH